MVKIYYNSWCEEFKKPFGSILENMPVRLVVEASSDRILAVELVVWQEIFGQTPDRKYIKMDEVSAGRFEFLGTLLDLHGLIFYYFIGKTGITLLLILPTALFAWARFVW